MIQIYMSNRAFIIDEKPNECPKCHVHIAPNDPLAFADISPEIQFVFQCTKCRELFISHYIIKDNKYIFNLSEPIYPKKIEIEKELKTLSPNFIEIYRQAIVANEQGLDQIAGIGLRKALEFLIKDFCIYKNSEKTEEIKELFLGACIKKYIENKRLKDIAERAAWLGNDETHYVRKWEEKDIVDLKELLRITRTYITTEIMTDQYIREMPAKET